MEMEKISSKMEVAPRYKLRTLYYTADNTVSTAHSVYIVSIAYKAYTAYIPPPLTLLTRPAQLAVLSRSEFDPELFSHSAYVSFFL